MEKLTLEQAFKYSIKKFELYVANDGQDVSEAEYKKIGVSDFLCNCGLCEYQSNILHEECKSCPLFIDGNSCYENDHVFQKWAELEDKDSAQAVLDLIKTQYKKFRLSI